MAERGIYSPPTVVTLTPHACTLFVLQLWCCALSTRNNVEWGRRVFSDESHFRLYPDVNSRCVLRSPGQCVGGNLLCQSQATQAYNKMLWSEVSSPLISGHLWQSFLEHWQHSSSLTAFYHRFRYHSFCDTLDLLFNRIMPGCMRHMLLWIVFKLSLYFLG